ncbi:hypothetical protein HID58_027178 [Brassica napus]|uniref:Uncharacterized protein n=1 Tax=Brassica napus TaxID=3708 RepID=A0ABQ8CR88_BRANA|nr:hypothetical protein HID58_027178 [Brassica napus]
MKSFWRRLTPVFRRGCRKQGRVKSRLFGCGGRRFPLHCLGVSARETPSSVLKVVFGLYFQGARRCTLLWRCHLFESRWRVSLSGYCAIPDHGLEFRVLHWFVDSVYLRRSTFLSSLASQRWRVLVILHPSDKVVSWLLRQEVSFSFRTDALPPLPR